MHIDNITLNTRASLPRLKTVQHPWRGYLQLLLVELAVLVKLWQKLLLTEIYSRSNKIFLIKSKNTDLLTLLSWLPYFFSLFWFVIIFSCGYIFVTWSNSLVSTCDHNARMKILVFPCTGHAYYGKFGKMDSHCHSWCHTINSKVFFSKPFPWHSHQIDWFSWPEYLWFQIYL